LQTDGSIKSRQGYWDKRLFQDGRTGPDPLPDTDVVVYPGRVYKFETVTPGRGFVRVISDSMRTVEQYGGVSIKIGEGLATCTALDHAWTIYLHDVGTSQVGVDGDTRGVNPESKVGLRPAGSLGK
jgi:hypothetical protein